MRYAAEIAPIAARCIIELRGEASAARRLAAAIELTLPRRANTLVRNNSGASIAWLGPRRWLIMTALEREAALRVIFERQLGLEPLLVGAIVSDMFAGYSLRGRECREILAQGTPLDVASGAFPADMASGTDFCGAPVILWRSAGADDAFELWVDRSLARYTEDWLAAARGAAPATARD